MTTPFKQAIYRDMINFSEPCKLQHSLCRLLIHNELGIYVSNIWIAYGLVQDHRSYMRQLSSHLPYLPVQCEGSGLQSRMHSMKHMYDKKEHLR
jgi:hypothetical protein